MVEQLVAIARPTDAGCDVPGADVSGASTVSSRDFFDHSFDELAQLLKDRFGLPAFRAQQLFEWIYRKRLDSFSEMSNIARGLRADFAEAFFVPRPVFRERLISSDGSRKYLFEVDNGDLVESVMIRQPNRMTLCVSSQVGCAMRCGFCRTGTMGLKRHLRTSEILQQVIGVIDDAKNFNDMFTNVVFMGMGEPLHNFDNVTRALSVMTDSRGLAIGGRKITISSVGLVPAIDRFGALGMGVNLAVSLNATTDEIRSRIMPMNERYPLEELLQCMQRFPLKKGRRITIEYVMLQGVNDSADDLARLPKMLRKIPCKVNLIPYNANAGLGFQPPARELIHRWQKQLNDHGYCTTIRWSKGADISAACGQLATESTQRSRRSAESSALAVHAS